MKNLGTVYLLHFDAKYKHAQYYIGWADDLSGRLDRHASGRGAEAVCKANYRPAKAKRKARRA